MGSEKISHVLTIADLMYRVNGRLFQESTNCPGFWQWAGPWVCGAGMGRYRGGGTFLKKRSVTSTFDLSIIFDLSVTFDPAGALFGSGQRW
jgi:hypothetical protein